MIWPVALTNEDGELEKSLYLLEKARLAVQRDA